MIELLRYIGSRLAHATWELLWFLGWELPTGDWRNSAERWREMSGRPMTRSRTGLDERRKPWTS